MRNVRDQNAAMSSSENNQQKNQSQTPSLKVGWLCVNCPHTHKDHSMYSPRLCYIEGCECPGLKLK